MNEQHFEQLPPHDLTAEQATIGSFSVSVDPAVRDRILTLVRPESFFQPDHQVIFRRMVEMHRAGKPIDLVTLHAELAAHGELADVGGAAAIGQAVESMPSAANGEHYATIVRDHHRRRCIYLRTSKAAESAFSETSDPLALASHLKLFLSEFLRRATGSALRSGGSGELAELITATESGERKALDWKWPILSELTKALFPNTITLLCGTPGDGKTFLMLAMLMDLLAADVPAAVFMLEGDRAYHLLRCLAVMVGDNRLLDDKYVRENHGWASSIREEHAETMEKIGRSIFDSTSEECSLDDLGRWIERESKDHRVLIIDPITLADAGDKRFVADQKFMRVARDAIQKTGSSLICVTHPKVSPNQKGPLTMDNLAGGAVYQRAAETVLLLKKYDTPKRFTVLDEDGFQREEGHVNRELRILKARNGRGGGQGIAYFFNGSRLEFNELGLIKQEHKDTEPAI